MSANKFRIELHIDGIGPHTDASKIDFVDNVESNKAIFFALNGTGKTFLSRAFRVIETISDKENNNDLISIGKNDGTLSFKIKTATDEKEIRVTIKRDSKAIVTNTTDLIFHVFNSDFVIENVAVHNYTPDGRIEGYIIGKSQIDLSEDKKKVVNLQDEFENQDKAISELIKHSKEELKAHGVMSTISEFSLINRDSLEHYPMFDDISSFDMVEKQLTELSLFPDNILDISISPLRYSEDFFDSAQEILSQSYPKSEWDNEFIKFYKDNRMFIEHGLDLMSIPNTCPYCHQKLDEDALLLIKSYNEFRKDKEALVLSEITKQIDAIDSLMTQLKREAAAINKAIIESNNIKKYFPSLSDYVIDPLDVSDFAFNCLLSLKEYLNEKANDISKVNNETISQIEVCRNYLKTCVHHVANAADVANTINKAKNRTDLERRELRRNLCKAQFNAYKEKLAPLFNSQSIIKTKLVDLQKEIQKKESTVKVSKKTKVFETLTTLLNAFFAGKYSLDQETFQLRFQGNCIGENASKILSDGEKSIVAYCYFLATTHLLIKQEDDYGKLFFIIDDPISSMDFTYVYLVAQTIRDIKALFSIRNYERVWVLTHNAEFLSIIARNHIINKTYSMQVGKIEELDHRLVLPYESHLIDIVKIARGEMLPTHTTGNSIRHVIETVCSFEYPEKGLETYVAENDILSSNAYIFSVCQDLSHGKIRMQMPFSNEVLKNACNIVVDFLNSKYKGQIDAIK